MQKRSAKEHNYIHSLLNHDEILEVLEHIKDMSYIKTELIYSKIYKKVKNNEINEKQFRILCTYWFDD